VLGAKDAVMPRVLNRPRPVGLFVLTVFGIGLMPAHRARRMMSGIDEPSCVAWPWRLVVLDGGKHQARLDQQA